MVDGVSHHLFVDYDPAYEVVARLEVEVVGEELWYARRADAEAGVGQVIADLHGGLLLENVLHVEHRHTGCEVRTGWGLVTSVKLVSCDQC